MTPVLALRRLRCPVQSQMAQHRQHGLGQVFTAQIQFRRKLTTFYACLLYTSLVAAVFDGFDLAATNADGLTKAFRDIDLAIAGTQGSGMRQNIVREVLQGLQWMAET